MRRSGLLSLRGSARSRPWTTRGRPRRRRRLGVGGPLPRPARRPGSPSTAVFESVMNRATVSSRALSAAVCIARLKSAMSFVVRRAGAGVVTSIMSGFSGSWMGRWIVRGCAAGGVVRRRVGVGSVRGPGKLEPRFGLGLCHGCRSFTGGDIGWVDPISGTWAHRGSEGWCGAVRWWYQRPAPVVPPGCTRVPGYHGRDGPRPLLRRPPRSDRHARSGDARPAHLGHRPLQLPLHLLHAQGDLREGLRVPAARPGPELRGDRANGAGVRVARGREAPDHRR